jgi:hypothetical protein
VKATARLAPLLRLAFDQPQRMGLASVDIARARRVHFLFRKYYCYMFI